MAVDPIKEAHRLARGEALKKWRQVKGLTGPQLALEVQTLYPNLNYTKDTIYNFESGRTLLDEWSAGYLAHALGISRQKLLAPGDTEEDDASILEEPAATDVSPSTMFNRGQEYREAYSMFRRAERVETQLDLLKNEVEMEVEPQKLGRFIDQLRRLQEFLFNIPKVSVPITDEYLRVALDAVQRDFELTQRMVTRLIFDHGADLARLSSAPVSDPISRAALNRLHNDLQMLSDTLRCTLPMCWRAVQDFAAKYRVTPASAPPWVDKLNESPENELDRLALAMNDLALSKTLKEAADRAWKCCDQSQNLSLAIGDAIYEGEPSPTCSKALMLIGELIHLLRQKHRDFLETSSPPDLISTERYKLEVTISHVQIREQILRSLIKRSAETKRFVVPSPAGQAH